MFWRILNSEFGKCFLSSLLTLFLVTILLEPKKGRESDNVYAGFINLPVNMVKLLFEKRSDEIFTILLVLYSWWREP